MTRFILIIALMIPVCALRAEELTSKHRLIGISAPERIADLHKTMDALEGIHLVALDAENAEITLRYDMEVLFPKYPPKKPKPTPEEIEKRLNDLIGAACVRTFSLKPPSDLPKEKITKVEIAIGLLDCKACRYAAYTAVASLDGVVRASVDMKTSLLTAWTDSSKVTRDDLEKALKKMRVELKQP